MPTLAPAPTSITAPDSTARGVTPRVVGLCLSLAVLFGYIIPIIDVKLSNTFLGNTHLPPGAIAVLLVLLLGINPLLGSLKKRWAFGRNEILTVYITCLFSVLVPGHGAENMFVSSSIGPFYFASPENKWLEWLPQNLPSWISPALSSGHGYDEAGRRVVAGWYEGTNGVVPWGAWLVPVVAWSLFIFASYAMLCCLGVILRAQWAQREALSFPLLRLPLELTADADARGGQIGAFFGSGTMWIGAGIAVFAQLLNGLNFYFPDVPKFPLGLDTAPYLTEAPWNQIGAVRVDVWPIVIGISYLLTSEISFSLWFFFWFFKLQFIAAYYLGWAPTALPQALGTVGQTPAFTGYQTMGCLLAYVALITWTGREHFLFIARRALGRTPATSAEAREALSYPLAFWGFVASFVFMVAWSVAAGIRWEIALLMWTIYVALAVALTRVVCEAGLLAVQPGWEALGRLGQLGGSGADTWLGAASVVPGAFLQTVMATGMSAFLLPSFVQGFKLAHDRQINARKLLALIASCSLIAYALSVWMNIKMGYESGGLGFNSWFANWGAKWPALKADELLRGARDVSWLNWVWMGAGGGLTWGMMAARARLMWFPFHPLGYMMALTYPMGRLWLSILLGWLCKSLFLRAGGDSYRRATPFFLGLALGDVCMMLLWLGVDAATGRTNHFLMLE